MSEIPKLISDLSNEFDDFVLERHETGQKKYGEFTFLEKDIIHETICELADIANYVRYQFIKLRMLQIALLADPRVEALEDETGQAVIGLESFTPNNKG